MKKLIIIPILFFCVSAFGQFTKPQLYSNINTNIRLKTYSPNRMAALLDSIVATLGTGIDTTAFIKTQGTSILTSDVNINGNGTSDFNVGFSGTQPVDINIWASNNLSLFGQSLASINSLGTARVQADDGSSSINKLEVTSFDGILSSADGITTSYLNINPTTIKLIPGDVVPAIGDVWTATNVDGSGGWSAPSTGFTDPMTTRGDIIYRNASNVTSRLGIGGAGTFLSSDGTDVSWQTPSGSGDMLLGTIQTVTARKDFNTGTFSLFNPANTFKYNFLGSAIVADRTVTLPLLTGNDTFVMNDFAATLTNKTIAAGSNTITGLVDANIGTHTTTKISTTSKSLLNSAIVYTDQINTFGDFNNTFRSTRLRIANPANTFSYSFTGAAIAADRAITLPLLTGGDVMVTEAFTQTLTNKTLNLTNNTLSGTTAQFNAALSDGDFATGGGTATGTNTGDQSISVTGTTTATIDLSADASDASITGAGISAVSVVGNAITVTSTEVDGSISNEGSLTVAAGTGTTSIINSNTSGSTGVTLTAGTALSIAEAGNVITFDRAALTGDVTASAGSNATTIAAGAVDIAMMSATGTPSASTYLRGDNTWATVDGGFTDPMTTRGDIIIRNSSNTTARLPIGSNTYVLTSDGTDVSWAAPPGAGSGLTYAQVKAMKFK